jgi:hypothetical protein
MPLDKKTFVANPDYSAIAGKAGTEKFSARVADVRKSVTLSYIDNFDGLSELLK